MISTLYKIFFLTVLVLIINQLPAQGGEKLGAIKSRVRQPTHNQTDSQAVVQKFSKIPEGETTSVSIRVNPSNACVNQKSSVWLYQQKILIQQILLPSKSSFTFFINPGKYTVSVKTDSNCFAKTDVDVMPNQQLDLDLDLVSLNRDPAQSDATAVQCACVRAPCPCNTVQPSIAPPYIPIYQYPWWLYYGNQFSHFYFPGPWSNYGVIGRHYPGSGNFTAYKPIVYFRGSYRGDIHFKLKLMNESTNLLATSPQHNSSGWKIKINNQQKILTDSSVYPYVFYDYRDNDEVFQNKYGFCGPRQESMDYMTSTLKSIGFAENEISDFVEYWQIKMPPDDVCIFPQTNEQLDRQVSFELKPSAQKVIRMVFMALIKEGITSGQYSHFKKLPERNWSQPKQLLTQKNKKGNYVVFEWGVGFPFVTEAKDSDEKGDR